jgi:hypothetical protein
MMGNLKIIKTKLAYVNKSNEPPLTMDFCFVLVAQHILVKWNITLKSTCCFCHSQILIGTLYKAVDKFYFFYLFKLNMYTALWFP